MKFLFLPSMAKWAPVFEVAPIFIWSDEIFCVPILAHIHAIVKDGRLSSIILPIVGINTYISFMIIFSIWTPNGLKVKDIEVHVRLKLFYKLYRKFSFIMREWAKLSIIAFFVLSIQVWWTKLCFVFVWMIKLLNSVMGLITRFSIRALLVTIMSSLCVLALFWLIDSKWSSPIFFEVMIIWALLQIVTLRITCTRLSFEKIQI